jgi:hypothetical protein
LLGFENTGVIFGRDSYCGGDYNLGNTVVKHPSPSPKI